MEIIKNLLWIAAAILGVIYYVMSGLKEAVL
jgi:hypothetical protein